MGIIFISSNHLFAKEKNGSSVKILKTQEYDYDGVCDFILARFEEVRMELSDAQEEKITYLQQFPSSQGSNIVKRYKYLGQYSEVEFIKVDSKLIITSAKLDYTLTHQYRSKEYILSRLGIKTANPDDAIEISCDALSSQLNFNKTELKTVVIKSNFID
jgi:hypothetical protein